jgi:preprotein translocase subunit SecE
VARRGSGAQSAARCARRAEGDKRGTMADNTTTTPAPSQGLVARSKEFFKDVRVEASKVSWPTRQELRDSTVVVIVSVILISVFVGLVDRVLTSVMGLLFR